MSARLAAVHRALHKWEAKRAEAALMDLIGWLHELDETKLDRAYFRSDQFADEFLQWFDRAVHTSNKTKREALRNALLNSTTLDWRGSGLADLFMPLVADFSPPQMQLLGVIERCQRPPTENEERFSDRNLEPPGFTTMAEVAAAVNAPSADHKVAFVEDFERRDLVQDWWKGTFKGQRDERAGIERVTLTPLGRDFLRFISAPPTRDRK